MKTTERVTLQDGTTHLVSIDNNNTIFNGNNNAYYNICEMMIGKYPVTIVVKFVNNEWWACDAEEVKSLMD